MGARQDGPCPVERLASERFPVPALARIAVRALEPGKAVLVALADLADVRLSGEREAERSSHGDVSGMERQAWPRSII